MADDRPNRPLHPAEIAHFEAKADKERAETHKLQAETRSALAHAEADELFAQREREKCSRELAADEHHNVYVFDQPVSEVSVKKCIGQLNSWARQDPGCAIEVQINSPGGSIFDGFALIDFIRDLQAKGHHITMPARSKVKEQFIRTRWRRKDWWLTAADALKYGFVDEIR